MTDKSNDIMTEEEKEIIVEFRALPEDEKRRFLEWAKQTIKESEPPPP